MSTTNWASKVQKLLRQNQCFSCFKNGHKKWEGISQRIIRFWGALRRSTGGLLIGQVVASTSGGRPDQGQQPKTAAHLALRHHNMRWAPRIKFFKINFSGADFMTKSNISGADCSWCSPLPSSTCSSSPLAQALQQLAMRQSVPLLCPNACSCRWLLIRSWRKITNSEYHFLQSCKCDLQPDCTCCKQCFECLDYLYSECCS